MVNRSSRVEFDRVFVGVTLSAPAKSAATEPNVAGFEEWAKNRKLQKRKAD